MSIYDELRTALDALEYEPDCIPLSIDLLPEFIAMQAAIGVYYKLVAPGVLVECSREESNLLEESEI